MRDRGLLHKSKLSDFIRWMEINNWEEHPTKGEYEVARLRLKKSKPKKIILIYDRNRNSTEHYTTYGLGERMVRRFIYASRKNDIQDN